MNRVRILTQFPLNAVAGFLLMKNNLTIALPELEVAPALEAAQSYYFAAAAQSGKVRMLDLRVAGEVAYHAATVIESPAVDPRMTSSIQ